MAAVKKQLVYVPISHIIITNTKTHAKHVDWLARHLDFDKLAALPAWWDGQGYRLTDGNHRVLALKLAGYDYAPVVLLTKREYDFVKFSKRAIEMEVHVPKEPVLVSLMPTPGLDPATLFNSILSDGS
jgi:hypothetical protein